jgi:hypothetical protein
MRRFSRTSKFRFTPAGFPMRWIVSQKYQNVTILYDSQ